MLHVKPITFEQATTTRLVQAESFLFEQCQLHYGDKITRTRYEALRLRLKSEMNRDDHALFIALNPLGEIVGCLTLSVYDDRIESIKGRYDEERVAEVSRCYVRSDYRRLGIGRELFDRATAFAKEKGYETLYLHTHYFLPGGFLFWQSMGFEITLDEGGSWQTVHMERLVEHEARAYA